MVIRRLKIKNFGKIRDKDMELSPGLNVLYGENESGKTTTHTFIRSMLFGIRRLRGKAAQNDTYTKYESGRIRRYHVVLIRWKELPSYQEFL